MQDLPSKSTYFVSSFEWIYIVYELGVKKAHCIFNYSLHWFGFVENKSQGSSLLFEFTIKICF